MSCYILLKTCIIMTARILQGSCCIHDNCYRTLGRTKEECDLDFDYNIRCDHSGSILTSILLTQNEYFLFSTQGLVLQKLRSNFKYPHLKLLYLKPFISFQHQGPVHFMGVFSSEQCHQRQRENTSSIRGLRFVPGRGENVPGIQDWMNR